jgi:hypothetical protein
MPTGNVAKDIAIWQTSVSWCGASLGGTLDYIPNPTIRLKKRRVFTFDVLIAS